jgi:thioredoxin 1
MVERIGIAVGLIVLGYFAWRMWQWRSLRRVNALHQGISDPILTEFTGTMPAIVYFTADFCTACQAQQSPTLNQLQSQLGQGGVQIIEVDVERQPETAQRWGVMSLPTTFVLGQDGTATAVNYGVANTAKLRKQIEDSRQ